MFYLHSIIHYRYLACSSIVFRNLSDPVLLPVRLLGWKWLLCHPSLNNPIFTLQQTRWSIPFLICSWKNGDYLHFKIVSCFLLLIYTFTIPYSSFLTHWIVFFSHWRNFTDWTLAYWWTSDQRIWTWIKGAWNPYRFSFL